MTSWLCLKLFLIVFLAPPSPGGPGGGSGLLFSFCRYDFLVKVWRWGNLGFSQGVSTNWSSDRNSEVGDYFGLL